MKITIVGAGQVGATLAQRVLENDLGDVVLVDVVEGVPQGKALDLAQAAPVTGHDRKIIGTNQYQETKNSDVVVITAGLARKPGMTREDLLGMNAKIVRDVVENIMKFSLSPIMIVVTNPLDIMTYLAYKASGLPAQRVIGMAGVLDSSRMAVFIAQALGVSVSTIQAMVLGSHGETMVPLPRFTTISGIPLPELMKPDQIEKIVQRTRDGGAEIVAHLKTGSAFYAPSAAVLQMVAAIVHDKKTVLPVSAFVQGEYGLRDLFIGVPAKLGGNGVEQIVELSLNQAEKEALHRSAKAIKEGIASLRL
jgi:malate dehydrogenase